MTVEAETDDPQTAHPARRPVAREHATPRASDAFLWPYSPALAMATNTAAGEAMQEPEEGK